MARRPSGPYCRRASPKGWSSGGASLATLRRQVRALGVPSLRVDGLRLMRDGRTTVAELWRVMGDEEPG